MSEDANIKPQSKPDKVPAALALEVARKFVRFLKPHCEKIIVAGSLRRRKPMVRDIEILFVPKHEIETDPSDLFGAQHQINVTERAIAALIEIGVLDKRPKSDGSFTWGPENKLGLHWPSGIAVDLFTTTKENWFNYLVCRTGSSENNIRICEAAIARGWKWNPYGSGFSRENPDERRIVTSEEEVFAFVSLPYKEPWER
jgi:DNA polymerase/3'-5' exonuclease PolX